MIYMDLITPAAYYSPTSAVYTRLFTRMVEDVLNEFSYDAELAGLHYSLYNTAEGLRLLVSGYNHKLAELLKAIVEKINSFSDWADPQRFLLLKDQVPALRPSDPGTAPRLRCHSNRSALRFTPCARPSVTTPTSSRTSRTSTVRGPKNDCEPWIRPQTLGNLFCGFVLPSNRCSVLWAGLPQPAT